MCAIGIAGQVLSQVPGNQLGVGMKHSWERTGRSEQSLLVRQLETRCVDGWRLRFGKE